MQKCGECNHYEVCKPYVTPDESFPEVEGGCGLFQPTADVVEVVRCKECKYSEDLGMAGIWCNHPDNRNPLGCRPTDYCNDGESKGLAQDAE